MSRRREAQAGAILLHGMALSRSCFLSAPAPGFSCVRACVSACVASIRRIVSDRLAIRDSISFDLPVSCLVDFKCGWFLDVKDGKHECDGLDPVVSRGILIGRVSMAAGETILDYA